MNPRRNKEDDYEHYHRRRYTDTCLYITPPSPLYTITTRTRLSCNPLSTSLSTSSLSTTSIRGHYHRRQRALSLDGGSIPLLKKQHLETRGYTFTLAAASTIVDNTTNTTGNPLINTQQQQHQQQHAMATNTAQTTQVNPVVNKSHTSIDITQRIATKAIRVERNYSKGDGITQFYTELPAGLEGKITLEEFQHTINTINALLSSAERLSWSGVFYNIMEIITIYLWPLFFTSHYQKTVRQLLQFIEMENKQVYQQRQLYICNPVKTAFLFLEIQVFD